MQRGEGGTGEGLVYSQYTLAWDSCQLTWSPGFSILDWRVGECTAAVLDRADRVLEVGPNNPNKIDGIDR